jgi:hypothetical protein
MVQLSVSGAFIFKTAEAAFFTQDYFSEIIMTFLTVPGACHRQKIA